MFVPAGRCDARPVAAAEGETRIRSENAGGLDIDALQAVKQGFIGLFAIEFREDRSMPCSADDGDAREACFLRGANTLAHMGLASCLVVAGWIERQPVTCSDPAISLGTQVGAGKRDRVVDVEDDRAEGHGARIRDVSGAAAGGYKLA